MSAIRHSLAAGGGSSKLKFGHRGHNHPVVFSKDTKLGFISSQNHGFFTTFDFLRDCAPLYTNLNDNTSAGNDKDSEYSSIS